MKIEPFLNFLGFGAKARKIVFGADATDNAIKRGKAKLVVLDGAASENTKKEFRNACAYYKVRLIVLDESDVLGRYLGKPKSKVIGIVCPQLAKSAEDKFSTISGGENIEQNQNH